MRYKCSFKNCVPSYDEVALPSFVSSTRKDVVRAIYDDSGKKVGTEKVSVPIVEKIPHEEFENLGMNCDLFSVENQKSAGVDLMSRQPLSTPLFGMTFDERSSASDYLENFNFDSLIEKKENDTINFNE